MVDVAFAAGAIGMLAAGLFMPTAVTTGPPACWLRALCGIECPFCGMSRSFTALLHGDTASAFAFHPGGPLLAVTLALFAGAVLYVWIRRRKPLADRPRVMRAVEAVAVLCLLLGVLRGVL
jgi:hypothetical protein